MDNPKAALNALLDSAVQVGVLEVHPLTVARYALLELAESPLIVGVEGTLGVLDVIPTVYIMTAPAAKLSKYNAKNIDQLKAEAFEWAEDNLTTGSIPAIVELLAQKLLDLRRLAPEIVEDSKKKLEEQPAMDGQQA